jgi:hypothetical protein
MSEHGNTTLAMTIDRSMSLLRENRVIDAHELLREAFELAESFVPVEQPRASRLPKSMKVASIAYRGVRLEDMSRADLLRVASAIAMKSMVRSNNAIGRISIDSINMALDLEDLIEELKENPPQCDRGRELT